MIVKHQLYPAFRIDATLPVVRTSDCVLDGSTCVGVWNCKVGWGNGVMGLPALIYRMQGSMKGGPKV